MCCPADWEAGNGIYLRTTGKLIINSTLVQTAVAAHGVWLLLGHLCLQQVGRAGVWLGVGGRRGRVGAVHLFWEMLPSLGQVLHRMPYVGRDLKDQWVPVPCCELTAPQLRLPSTQPQPWAPPGWSTHSSGQHCRVLSVHSEIISHIDIKTISRRCIFLGSVLSFFRCIIFRINFWCWDIHSHENSSVCLQPSVLVVRELWHSGEVKKRERSKDLPASSAWE